DPDELRASTPAESARLELLHKTHAALGELIIARLGKLPPTARLPLANGQEMLVVHGSPADPSVAMGVEMTDDELNALLGDEPADIVVCGASHVPFTRVVGDTQIVNVGCVGERPTAGFANATTIDTLSMGLGIEQFVIDV
ncbi:MAG TPA: metallophosphoesterase family protein, partial [Polyangiaceae bacterium]|nr:metallophosphoesterase family protein [Polyangiaceae bacterium]